MAGRWKNRRLGGDPRWITVRRAGVCGRAGCGEVVPAGSSAFWYPTSGTLYPRPCGHGERAAREFEAMRFDDEQGAA